MNYDAITPELLEKADACETPQEVMELAKAHGLELTDADLDAIAAGDKSVGPITEETLKKLPPEEREKREKLEKAFRKWVEKERHPGWQGH